MFIIFAFLFNLVVIQADVDIYDMDTRPYRAKALHSEKIFSYIRDQFDEIDFREYENNNKDMLDALEDYNRTVHKLSNSVTDFLNACPELQNAMQYCFESFLVMLDFVAEAEEYVDSLSEFDEDAELKLQELHVDFYQVLDCCSNVNDTSANLIEIVTASWQMAPLVLKEAKYMMNLILKNRDYVIYSGNTYNGTEHMKSGAYVGDITSAVDVVKSQTNHLHACQKKLLNYSLINLTDIL